MLDLLNTLSTDVPVGKPTPGPVVQLTSDQEAANTGFLDFLISGDNYLKIQGSAGTGKSFLIKHLINTYHSRYAAYSLLFNEQPKNVSINVTATTNKAVNVLHEFLNDVNKVISVQTIYQHLGLRIMNDYTTGQTYLKPSEGSMCVNGAQPTLNPGDMRLVFIDEASFISEELYGAIDKFMVKMYNMKVVLIGDRSQLAPVGQAFSVFDSIQCTEFNLTEVKRNAGIILKTGIQFKDTVENGRFNKIIYDNKDLVSADGPTFQAEIEKAFKDPSWTPDTCKILAWTNSRVQEYNRHVRDTLNRSLHFEEGETVITNKFITRNGFTASVDDRVVVTRIIEPKLKHGITGTNVELDHTYVGFLPDNYEEVKSIMKQLAFNKAWKDYFDIKDNWLDLRAVYASSIHKAQGSTYEKVFIDLTDIGRNWQANDVARLLYVAITRASKQVICYGELPDRYKGV